MLVAITYFTASCINAFLLRRAAKMAVVIPPSSPPPLDRLHSTLGFIWGRFFGSLY